MTSTPSTWIVPDVGAVVAHSTSTSSVWPLPLTPATPTISPGATLIDTSSRRRTPSTSSVTSRTSSTADSADGPRRNPTRPPGASTVAPTAGAIAASADIGVSDHQIGEPAGVEPAGRLRRHDAAPPQHGDAVGDGDDLAQLVGDEHDADALGAQPADRAEQGVDVQGGEHGGRLVEDQHPAVVGAAP